MATWSGVITNAGNSVLNEWVNEKGLSFDGAAAGQGTVAEKAMMAQTALVSQRQTASLLGGEKVSTGIRLKIRITAPETAYTLNQYGVWASVTGGASVMIAIFQMEDGIPIPSKVESPDFVYTFYALIMCSNTGSWTVNVDTSTSVTVEEMNAAIDKAAALKQDKLTGKQGQMVGFDSDGNAVAQYIPDPGVTSFNGRTGDVKPSSKDYTAQMVGAIPTSQKGAAGGVAELDAGGAVPSEQMPGYAVTSGVCAMGQTCPGGPLKVDNIRGNTILGGTPAYDAPVSMESVEGPLKLRVAGKNLVRPAWNLESQTQTGVTCTRNGNSFTLAGTNSGSGGINFYIQRYNTASAFSLPAGTYTMSGMPARETNEALLLGLYRRLPGGTNEQLAYDYGKPSRNKQTFTLSEATDNLFLAIVVGVGVNADGVTVTPQIEAGSEATAYEEPSNAIVEIPLLGTDGQSLEPLRMSYIGRYGGGNRVEVPDRIIRKDGVWCVERNAAVADLTAATWGTSANYLAPNLNGDLIRGKESHWVLCTHFPPSGANPSTVWTAGIWMGNGMAINKESLPNSTDTTPKEMAAWCAAQSEAGTPVLAIYTRNEPVYEELHQDVQVLLNTLTVPGGMCSVWVEGDVCPSGADIGLPRGDYPCSGVEGAYRWLEELSNPLPAPTTTDLYAWALTQQRGGVFATDGAVTTQNVPEAGNLTGILSVTEQGSAVSMLVFGPTGKIHTAIRIAGVWRGWTTLYGPLSKPTPADLGAAAASHNHSADQITSGILPLARGGLGASTWSTALDNLHGMARQATYYNEASAVDIDAITDGLALVPTAASKGCPISGSFVFIMQMFYGNLDTTRSRTQIAFPYAGGNGIAVRSYDSNKSVWSEWNLVYTANTPPPVMTGATSSKAGTAGLAPAPAAGAQNKYLRGDGTWQTPTNTTYSEATTSKAGLMSAADKEKLDGVATGANKYVHPSYDAKRSGLYKVTVDDTGHVSAASEVVKSDITTLGIPAQDTTYGTMGAATSSAAGKAGLVPAPAAGAQGKFLRGDGTWQTPYTHPSYAAKVSGLYKITVDKTGHVSGAETIHTGRAARFVIGTSTAGWTEADCDYLCDGTADEVEIKAAISALPSGGGEILLLDGTYNISSSIAISKANVVLRGSGPSTVLKRMFNSTSANGVIGCSAAHCRICSMDVDGNKTAYASDDNRAIYASQSASYIEIDHVTAKNSDNGISLSGMTGASILNCIVQTTSARGVYISGASGILLDGNLISGNGGTGINVQRTEDIRILNSTIGNTVDYGISIDAESKRGMISGNTCDQPQDNQSVMIHGSAFVVTGNVVGSISLGSGSKSNIVAHNILTSEDVSDTGTDNTVEGNKVVKEEATA